MDGRNVNRHFNYFNGVEFHKFLSSEEDQNYEKKQKVNKKGRKKQKKTSDNDAKPYLPSKTTILFMRIAHELIYNSHHVLAEMSLSEHRALKINFLFFSFSLTSDVDSRILLANTHDRKFYVRDAGGYSSVSSITRAVSALQLVQLYIYVFNQTAICLIRTDRFDQNDKLNTENQPCIRVGQILNVAFSTHNYHTLYHMRTVDTVAYKPLQMGSPYSVKGKGTGKNTGKDEGKDTGKNKVKVKNQGLKGKC
ncbi:hypothetical protein F4703DRAFT_1791599 [Phycomyces blakesleeanus]